MEELLVDPNLYALEEMMSNHQWNDTSFDDDFEDDERFLFPETEPIHSAA